MSVKLEPVGIIRSIFREKFGTPRQGWLSPHSRGFLQLTVEKAGYQALDGLEDFSHCWIVFMFNVNTSTTLRYKINPPRAGDRKRIGVFATRAPHRPNCVGMTMAKIEYVNVNKGILGLSALDLVDGTTVLDVKPYILGHDCPKDVNEFRSPAYITQAQHVHTNFKVEFSESADDMLASLAKKKAFDFYETVAEVKQVIVEILESEPRDSYRRERFDKGDDRWCRFRIDVISVNCIYSDSETVMVDSIEDWTFRYREEAKEKKRKAREEATNALLNSSKYECCDVAVARLKYCNDHSTPMSAELEKNAQDTVEQLKQSAMLAGQMAARVLSFFVDITKSKRILEIGTYSGYSAIALAQKLDAEDEENLLVCIDDFSGEPKSELLAIDALNSLKVKTQLRKGVALKELKTLVEEGAEPFDFVFMDADKTNQIAYYDLLLEQNLLKVHGLLCVDNTLWSSRVLQENVDKKDTDTISIKEFNNYVVADGRCEVLQLPIRDGLTLLKRKC